MQKKRRKNVKATKKRFADTSDTPMHAKHMEHKTETTKKIDTTSGWL